MPRILFFDLSQSGTGVAWDDPRDPGRPISDVWRLPRAGGDKEDGYEYGQMFATLHERMDMKIAEVRPEMGGFEQPMQIGGGHSTKKTPQHTIRILHGLAAYCEGTFYEHKIPCRDIHLNKLKKHFTGDAYADKGQMIARCKQLGWQVQDDNAADACAGWSYLKALYERGWQPSSAMFIGRRIR